MAAGVAALMLSLNPQMTSAEVLAVLRDSATDLGDPGQDALFGHGLVNAQRALKIVLFGLIFEDGFESGTVGAWSAEEN